MEFITQQLTAWHWLTIGPLLFVIELFAPTTFLFWPAIAALVTGVIVLFIPIGWQLQVALFAALAILITLAGRYYFKEKLNSAAIESTLNRRGDAIKGRTLTLAAPIENGVGSAIIDNTRWRLVGPDVPAGTKLVVTGTEGSSLIVEVATS